MDSKAFDRAVEAFISVWGRRKPRPTDPEKLEALEAFLAHLGPMPDTIQSTIQQVKSVPWAGGPSEEKPDEAPDSVSEYKTQRQEFIDQLNELRKTVSIGAEVGVPVHIDYNVGLMSSYLSPESKDYIGDIGWMAANDTPTQLDSFNNRWVVSLRRVN